MFEIKAPLVEQVVAWKMVLFTRHLLFGETGLSPTDKYKQYHERQFSLRQELWIWNVPRLKAEVANVKAEETIAAFA